MADDVPDAPADSSGSIPLPDDQSWRAPFATPSFDAAGDPVPWVTGDQSTGRAGDYDSGAKLGAALLTVFAPFISLIIALVMRQSETNPLRRASLRTWALISSGWLGIGVIAGIIGLSVAASSVPEVSQHGPCLGGPVIGASGTSVGNGDFRFPCADGGSTVIHLGN